MAQSANPDKAFRAELNQYLDAKAAEERRIEAKANHAADLMDKGQPDDPWTFEHFEEAMANAPEAARKLMWEYFEDANNSHFTNGKKNYLALKAMSLMVETYWMQIAIQDAEDYFAQKWN